MIMAKDVYFPDEARYNIPMSENCRAFISRLLDKNPQHRLGTRGGLEEVLSHPWFAELDHEKILAKRVEAPVRPQLSSNIFDVSQFDSTFTQEAAEVTMVEQSAMRTIKNNQG